MSKSNAASITNYTDGVTTEAYTFNHEATAQTPALTDYRYIGASPNNYVEFNCDDNGENCEVWRAIGVFYVDDGDNNWEWRVKLVRKSQFEDEMQWNSESNNDWSQSSLNLFLNNAYYNSIQDAVEFGLKSTSRKMVENSKYYLGGFSYDIARNIWYSETRFGNAKEIYSWERGNNLCGACGTDTTKLSWIGKIGLMYASDIYMVYDYGVNNQCYDDPLLCRDWGTIGWINIDDFIDSNGYTWLISPFSDIEYVSIINAGCNLFDTPDYNVKTPFSIHPVLYLSSSVKTTSGDGSIDSPYKLSL